jgi:serine/threonine protein kinase
VPDAETWKKWRDDTTTEWVPESCKFQKLNYKQIKKLGNGGFGEVHLVKHLPTGMEVALKLIEKRKAKYKEIRNEISILRTVDHPNLLKFLGWGMGSRNIYIVTEVFVTIQDVDLIRTCRARGGDLFDLIHARQSFFQHDAAEILTAMLNGIEYMHSLGIIHRDIKVNGVIFELNDTLIA